MKDPKELIKQFATTNNNIPNTKENIKANEKPLISTSNSTNNTKPNYSVVKIETDLLNPLKLSLLNYNIKNNSSVRLQEYISILLKNALKSNV